MMLARLRSVVAMVALLLTAGCLDNVGPVAPEPDPDPDPRVTNPHADQALFLDAARAAWQYADRQYQP
ncbi:MAG: hypothetical protein KY444_11510, partial [Gemmatimonadetes bacterium]|nr:hypothetical protein [Gemmatimonadota bacterium]